MGCRSSSWCCVNRPAIAGRNGLSDASAPRHHLTHALHADTANAGTTVTTISVSHLTKRFGPTLAVDDLSFHVRPGVVTGFLGPNGSGKSTTMRMLLGLVRPTSGLALIGDVPYRELDDPPGTVGALLEADAFHPARSGRAHLEILAAAAGRPRRRVDDVLATVGLIGAADRPAGGYSLGMRQRLGIAGALLTDPEVLILDEPANGLDPQGVRDLRTLLRDRAARGSSVLVSSHQLAEMALIADEVIVIRDGALVTHDRVDALTAEHTRALWVSSPQAERLGALVQQAGGRVHADGGPHRLVVEELDAPTIARLALDARIEVHELTERTHSLEDAFLELTASS